MSRKSALAALLRGVDVRDDVLTGRHGDIPIRHYSTRSGADSAPLVWAHGGAFAAGGLDQLESHAVGAALAQRGTDVIAVDYRLVPRWNPWRDAPSGDLPGIRFPIPLDDVRDAFATIVGRHPDAVLGGASAGACLSLAAALRQRDLGLPQPTRLILAYGTFHAELPALGAKLTARVRGIHSLLQFRPATVRRLNINYAGSEAAMRDVYAFPGGGDFTGLPPTLVLNADRDTLRASGDLLVEELEAARAPVMRRIVHGSTHGFLDRPRRPHFTEGIDVIAGWLDETRDAVSHRRRSTENS